MESKSAGYKHASLRTLFNLNNLHYIANNIHGDKLEVLKLGLCK